jgi:4-hydroxybenzoate polyprenyltransferase
LDIAAFVKLARPAHWVKNVFILMPIPYSLASDGVLDPTIFLLGFVGFCLANSGVYALNDAHDAEQDRLSESKKTRPIASGRISQSSGLIFSAVLLAVALALAWSTGRASAIWITVAYIAINIVYSFFGRSVALLDVFLLSSGFVLRVLLGCALVGVVASNWILLCSSTLALFLGFAKRRGDLVAGMDGAHRPSLAGYNMTFLDQAIGVTSGMAIVAYALYCMESPALVAGREFATLPFVVFGVFEYLRIVHVKSQGASPVEILLTNRLLQLCGVGWTLATFWSLRA